MASDLGGEMDTETEIYGDIRNLLPREGSVNAYGFHLGEMKANRTKMMARHVVKHGPLTNCLYLYASLFMQNYLQSEENGTKRRLPVQVC